MPGMVSAVLRVTDLLTRTELAGVILITRLLRIDMASTPLRWRLRLIRETTASERLSAVVNCPGLTPGKGTGREGETVAGKAARDGCP